MLCRVATYHRAKSGLSAAQLELTSANERVSALTTQLERLEKAGAEHLAGLAGLEAQVSAQHDAAVQLSNRVAHLSAQLEEERGLVQRLQQNLRATEEREQQLLGGNEELQHTVISLQHSSTQAQAASDAANLAYSDLQAQYAALCTEHQELQKRFVQEQESAAQAAVEARAQLKRSRREQEAVAKRLEHLQEALVSMYSVVEELEMGVDDAMPLTSDAVTFTAPSRACTRYNSLRESKQFQALLRESTAALQPGAIAAMAAADSTGGRYDQGLGDPPRSQQAA